MTDESIELALGRGISRVRGKVNLSDDICRSCFVSCCRRTIVFAPQTRLFRHINKSINPFGRILRILLALSLVFLLVLLFVYHTLV